MEKPAEVPERKQVSPLLIMPVSIDFAKVRGIEAAIQFPCVDNVSFICPSLKLYNDLKI